MRFRPCIDIHKGKVKQIVGSTLRDAGESDPVTNFETDLPPSYYARLYRHDHLIGGHVIMLGPGNEPAALEALRAYPGGLQVGGGIMPLNASRFLDAGASHIIITSYVFRDGRVDWEKLDEIERVVGKDHLVLDLSCKKKDDFYYVVTDRWQKFTDVTLSPESLRALGEHCDEFLIHAADIEGMQQGIDGELVELLAITSPVPATYAGGIRTLDDLCAIRDRGMGRIDATVGSALDIFGGSLPYRNVVEWNATCGKM